MSIEQEKTIVEALPSLYPLKDYEEDAIHTVLEALPHWIPVEKERPKEDGEYIVTIQCEHVDGWDDYVTGFAEWNGDGWDLVSYYLGQIKAVAWMPLPEPFKGVTK